jgi:hypothetical protein
MAIYKHATYLTKSEDAAFDPNHSPGTPAPFSGIYRCMGCHREVASNEGQPLPPQNHHQHTQAQGTIRWRLVVYADHKPK